MAITTLVPQTSGIANILSSQDQCSAECNSGVRPTTSYSTTSSRVAYLRQHYASKGLSGEASDLLMSSWRQKTSQSYDKRWISWCTEREADPVSGLIEDVANFLAHLYISIDPSTHTGQPLPQCTLRWRGYLLVNIHWSPDY